MKFAKSKKLAICKDMASWEPYEDTMFTHTDPSAACKGRPLNKQMGNLFFKLFIRLIVDSFELTPVTLLNDMCTIEISLVDIDACL